MRFRLESLYRNCKHVTELLLWQWSLSWQAAAKAIAASVLLALVGTLVQFAAIVTVLLYLRWRTQDGPVTIAGLQFDFDALALGVSGWVVTIIALSGIAACAVRWSAVLAQSAAEKTTRYYLSEVLERVLRLPASTASPTDPDRAELNRVYIGETMVLLRSIVSFLALPLPLLTLSLASVALLVMSPFLTVLIVVPLLALGVPYWSLNRGIVQASRSLHSASVLRSNNLKKLLSDALDADPGVAAESSKRKIADVEGLSQTEEAIGAIMLKGARVDVLRIVYLGVALAGALLAADVFIGQGKNSWTSFAAYVVAVRFAVSSLGGVASTVLNLARFVPQLERLRTIWFNGTPAPHPNLGATTLGQDLHLEDDSVSSIS